jgi:hypothetical protein
VEDGAAAGAGVDDAVELPESLEEVEAAVLLLDSFDSEDFGLALP